MKNWQVAMIAIPILFSLEGFAQSRPTGGGDESPSRSEAKFQAEVGVFLIELSDQLKKCAKVQTVVSDDVDDLCQKVLAYNFNYKHKRIKKIGNGEKCENTKFQKSPEVDCVYFTSSILPDYVRSLRSYVKQPYGMKYCLGTGCKVLLKDFLAEFPTEKKK